MSELDRELQRLAGLVASEPSAAADPGVTDQISQLAAQVRARNATIARARVTVLQPTVSRAILVWPFRHAPADWRALADATAEWVAFVPDGIDAPDWIIYGTQFDRRSAAHPYQVPGGAVWIGSRA